MTTATQLAPPCPEQVHGRVCVCLCVCVHARTHMCSDVCALCLGAHIHTRPHNHTSSSAISQQELGYDVACSHRPRCYVFKHAGLYNQQQLAGLSCFHSLLSNQIISPLTLAFFLFSFFLSRGPYGAAGSRAELWGKADSAHASLFSVFIPAQLRLETSVWAIPSGPLSQSPMHPSITLHPLLLREV